MWNLLPTKRVSRFLSLVRLHISFYEPWDVPVWQQNPWVGNHWLHCRRRLVLHEVKSSYIILEAPSFPLFLYLSFFIFGYVQLHLPDQGPFIWIFARIRRVVLRFYPSSQWCRLDGSAFRRTRAEASIIAPSALRCDQARTRTWFHSCVSTVFCAQDFLAMMILHECRSEPSCLLCGLLWLAYTSVVSCIWFYSFLYLRPQEAFKCLQGMLFIADPFHALMTFDVQ